MCPKYRRMGCEDGDCMEYIIVKEICVYEIPKHKYSRLKQELGVDKLFHVDEDLIQLKNRLTRMADEIIIEDIEIDDGTY